MEVASFMRKRRSEKEFLNFFCFLVLVCAPLESAGSPGSASINAARIVNLAGVQGGLALHIGCSGISPAVDLAASYPFVVHGLCPDRKLLPELRKAAARRGLAGKVSFSAWQGPGIPFVDNSAKLIVVEDSAGVSAEEIQRVLAPGGAALLRDGDGFIAKRKVFPRDMDQWTHFLHDPSNNAVAEDRVVGPPRHLQWLADPRWARYHHALASVSAVVVGGGRIFAVIDEGSCASIAAPSRWFLVARDASSGVLLWKRRIKRWAWHRQRFRSGPVQLPRTLVVGENEVYFPEDLFDLLVALDAQTGRLIRVYEGTKGVEEVLCSEGVLYVVKGEPIPEQAGIDPAFRRKISFPNRKHIIALEAASGRRLWRWSDSKTLPITPLTLAVSKVGSKKRVFFQDADRVMCLDAATGHCVWYTAIPAKQFKAGAKSKSGAKRRGGRMPRRGFGWSLATLVVRDGVVLLADSGKLSALEASNGRLLWEAPCESGFRSPADVFVIDGLVWTGPDFTEGRDLRTGRVKVRKPVLPVLRTSGHHHRCYRQKATVRYVLENYRGVEFLDLVDQNHCRHNWVRATCQYGVVPCYGLLYAPPHACGCFMETLLHGFWALAAERKVRKASSPPRLERGEAWGTKPEQELRAPWPLYRHDPQRSGATDISGPRKLAVKWRAGLDASPSAPVVGRKHVIVSEIDSHSIVAFNRINGSLQWRFEAGGRVDSPPTLWRGLVFFGCADGYVYCLRQSDGKLVWRFRAAPEDLRTVVRERVESVWPVHGSLIVRNGVVYAVAGRNSYLDGGFTLWALRAEDGAVRRKGSYCTQSPCVIHPDVEKTAEHFVQNAVDKKTFEDPDRSDAFSMAGTRSDVLVSDGEHLYLHTVQFDMKLRATNAWGLHLFSTSSLLDGAENHRCHWVYGTGDFRRLPVAYSWIANNPRNKWGTRLARPYGLLLSLGAARVWGVRRRRAGGPSVKYLLFCVSRPQEAERSSDFRKVKEVGPEKFFWTVSLKFRPRALLRAGPVLYVGGVARAGAQAAGNKTGGIIAVFEAGNGELVSEIPLSEAPIWDGMAFGENCLCVATEGGGLIALGPK